MNRQQGELFRRFLHQFHDSARQWVGLPERILEHPPIAKRLRRTLDALGETVFPAGGSIPYSGMDVDVSTYVLDFLRKIPRQEGELFTLIILLYEYVLPKVWGKGWRFSDMPESKRAELLEALSETPFFPVRFLNISMRMFLSFAYLNDERVLKEVGFFKRYEYPSDPRNIEIRWWPLREENAETQETEEPVANLTPSDDKEASLLKDKPSTATSTSTQE